MKYPLSHFAVASVLMLVSLFAKADVFTLDLDKNSFMKSRTSEESSIGMWLLEEPAESNKENSLPPAVPREGSMELKAPQVISQEFRTTLTKSCQIRSKPTNNSAPVKDLAKGTEVTVTPFNKEWRKLGEAYLSGICIR